MPFEKVMKFLGLEMEETAEEKKKHEEERKKKEEEKKKLDRSAPHGRWQMKNEDWNELEQESR